MAEEELTMKNGGVLSIGALPKRAMQGLWQLGWFFPANTEVDSVATTAFIAAPPEDVWRALMFYEQVPGQPPLHLRVLLPAPLRASGDSEHVGQDIECVYNTGKLLKRITVVEPPTLLRFEVLEQRLGMEGCMQTIRGSYEIHPVAGGSEVVLTTVYSGHLRPRSVWRPIETQLAHGLHRHIIDGMRVKCSV